MSRRWVENLSPQGSSFTMIDNTCDYPLAFVTPTPYAWWVAVTHDLTVGIHESYEKALAECERLAGDV